MKPYVQYKSNGTIWRAGHTIFGLCAAYNHATAPYVPMTDTDHHRSVVYARAIRARMRRHRYVMGVNYREMSNGMYWPISG